MGFPVELITVTNPNDIVSRTFKSGDWRMNKDVKATWASAMDIQVNIKSYFPHRNLVMGSGTRNPGGKTRLFWYPTRNQEMVLKPKPTFATRTHQ